MVLNEMKLPEEPEGLLVKTSGGEALGGGVAALPDAAMVCSCENVSKGAICCSVKDDGITDLGELKKATKAGTGCGGCLPMVKDIMAYALEEMGVSVKKSI